MEEKLREYFDDMVVFKDLKESNFFKGLKLPSFLRDWLLKMFENEDGQFDVEEVANFVKTYIPSKTEWIGIKNRIVVENERVKLLTRISIDINITTHEVSFSLPDFGLGNKETIIDPNVWDECKDDLVKAKETWGVIELAPKGTGKSYLYGGVSRYGYLSAGKMTRAKLFYDLARREEGLVFYHDYIAFDEIQKVEFDNVNEMTQTLQGYMEQGTVKIGDKDDVADAGFVMLGNIDEDKMDEYQNMFEDLPLLFRTSALMDRIHGFIKGWDIPRMNEGLKISGWALNSEYFSTIMHLLRNDISYRAIVDKIVDYPSNADTRDTEAIKRIATAYMKLLFPNVRSENDIKPSEFNTYCLTPAKKMRQIIVRQMGMIDLQYKGKNVPTFTIRDYE